MNSAPDSFEADFGPRVSRFVASANLHAPSETVAGTVVDSTRAARQRLRTLPVAAVAILIAVGLLATVSVFLQNSASSIPHASVSGVTYDVVVDRTISVEPAELSRYAAITASDYAWAFSEPQAYRLEGVDPRALLLVPAKPGAGNESWGEYLLLRGPADPYPSACRYHDDRLGEIPSECSGG